MFAYCFEVLEISRQRIGHEKIRRFPRPYSACSPLQELRAAVKGKRQAASAFKPFVFAAAIEAGLSPNSLVADYPRADEKWPEKLVSRFYGKITLRQALARSANIATIRLCKKVGPKAVAKVAKRLGIRSKLPEDTCHIALGVAEVSLLELTAAYVPFANEGMKSEPFGYWGAISSDGEIVYWRPERRKQVIDKRTAKAMRSMLRNVVTDGTGKPAKKVKNAAGKTGTSDFGRDAWFIGMTNAQLTGVWIGSRYDDPGSLAGSDAAALWADVVESYVKSK